MNHMNSNRSAQVWRMAIILLGVLLLCSCRSDGSRQSYSPQPGISDATDLPAVPPSDAKAITKQAAVSSGSGVVPVAYLDLQPEPPAKDPPAIPTDGPCIMGMPGMQGMPGMLGMPGMEGGAPLPYTAAGPWIPPGIVPPWPADEYLRDGGENPPGVAVAKNGELLGLQMEDTVARFTTLDGRTLVEPSNKVDLYSPRFNAVRQVVDAEVDQQRRRATGIAEPVQAIIPRTSEPVALSTQDLQAIRGIGTNPPGQLRARLTHATNFTDLLPYAFDMGFRPYENVSMIRTGTLVASDEPILARSAQAAITWSQKAAVQVILDLQSAAAAIGTQTPQLTYTVGNAPNPRLRLVKVASTPVAEPGDEVSFTIRFDNVGNQPIGSVQIIDSLTTRLEYVPGSAQSSLKARFTTQPNEGESLVVRCILDDPLPAGKGGVFRFRCIVR
jgi:uncharacterized repeat protein (TIGR01451 family)